MNDASVQHECNETVKLMDLLIVLWRWKFFVVGVTILTLIVTTIILFLSDNVYRASMIIEPIALDKKGPLIDSPQSIKQMIDSKSMKRKILERMGGKHNNKSLSFLAKKINNTNQLMVFSDSVFPDTAIETLRLLLSILKGHYQSVIHEYINKQQEKVVLIDQQSSSLSKKKNKLLVGKKFKAEMISKDISAFSTKKDNIKNIITITKQRRIDTKNQINIIEKNKEALDTQKKKIVYSKFLEYKDLFLVSLSLDKQLASLHEAIYKLQIFELEKYQGIIVIDSEIKKLESEIKKNEQLALISLETVNDAIDAVELTKKPILEKITNAKILLENKGGILLVSPPKVLISPIRPERVKIIFLTLVSSLFLSVMAIFVIEYIKNVWTRVEMEN